MSLDKGTSEAVPFVRIKINTLELRPNVKFLVIKARTIILRVFPPTMQASWRLVSYCNTH